MPAIVADFIPLPDGFGMTNPKHWKRSRRGNIYRRWGCLLLTVYERDGWWYWSARNVERADQVKWSPERYGTEEEAAVEGWVYVRDRVTPPHRGLR